MRLVSFNVLHGLSPADGVLDPDRLAAAVRALQPDVLVLQEVDRGQPRSGGADLTAVAAEAMGAPPARWRFAPALYGTPGRAWLPAADASAGADDPRPVGTRRYGPQRRNPAVDVTGGYGNALVSRFPVRRWLRVGLPRAPVRSPLPAPGRRVPLMLLDDEPRVALAAVVEAPGGPLSVAGTHLSFVPGWNAVQFRRLLRALGPLPDPLVLLGDLNLPGALPGRLSRWRVLAPGVPTYPSWEPRVQLDHALARGGVGPVRAARAERMALSDHCALVVELGPVP